MIIKRVSLWLLATVFLTAVSFADAQQSSKVYRVGRLSGGLSSSTFSLDALRRELRELGYVEGKNIAFELRYAEEKPERLPALADELVRLKVDVIVAGGPNDGLTAMKATKTIPSFSRIPPPIRLRLAWSTAWLGREGTSRDFSPCRMF